MNALTLQTLVGISTTVALLLGMWIGYLFGRSVGNKQDYPQREEPETFLVKRTRPSFRHPGKVTTTYDEYKTSKGLYSPIRPGKGSTADERDIK